MKRPNPLKQLLDGLRRARAETNRNIEGQKIRLSVIEEQMDAIEKQIEDQRSRRRAPSQKK